ncbi:MAG TPA: GTPase Era, partial [Nitrospiraceae bacterium]|nr:GTPase Era [Nitrospiraceae bacterium]
ILGVVHRPDAQILVLDTPGLHKPQYRLNSRMVRAAIETLGEADVIYVMVEATCPPGPGDRFVIEQVRDAVKDGGSRAFLLINKVDAVNKARVLPLIDAYRTMLDWAEVIPLSASTGINVDRLLDLTVKLLPEGQAPYGEDFLTDQPMRALAAELIREKILQQTRDELPYAVAVAIDRFEETGKLTKIAATILVEKDSQKAIVVGKGGQRLKEVGTAARLDMERLFGMKVFLELWVKVQEGWREDEQALAELGY